MSRKAEEQKETKRTHSYIVLALLFLICIVIVLYVCKIYKVNEEENLKIPVIRDSITEIYLEDLEHYVLDNPVAVIYVCTADNEKCRSFEKSFKKLLRKKDYRDQIIYLNVTDVDQDSFISGFNQKYAYKNPLTSNYPAFILFEDGVVESILQSKNDKTLTINKVKNFLDLYEIGE